MEKDIFFISPVRVINEELLIKCKEHIMEQEGFGKTVYFPFEDTNQGGDDTGYRICTDNKNAIKSSKEVHIYLAPKSIGSFFDIGMALICDKPLYIVNLDDFDLKDPVEEMIACYSTNITTKGNDFYNNILSRKAEIIHGSKTLVYNYEFTRESLVEFGMLFASERRFIVANRETIEETPEKSFNNVARYVRKTNYLL